MVIRFISQFEYWLHGRWQAVVRYDHDRTSAGGHDVTEEELDRMPERISRHFDRVRSLLAEELVSDRET